jgi:hypothetical protein
MGVGLFRALRLRGLCGSRHGVKPMRLPSFDREWTIGLWQTSLMLTPGWLAIGVYFDDDPPSVFIHVPFMVVGIERRDYQGTGRDWCWMLFRLIVGRQEMRFEFTANCWVIGLQLIETDDYSFHLGPIDIECEYNKFFADNDFTVRLNKCSRRVPVVRL